jgi:endoglucanase
MDLNLLERLSLARGASGDEGAVRSILAEVVGPLVDELQVDTIGNLIAIKRGASQSGLKVMVAAHMDEVGLMVVGADNNGFLRFRPVGGVDARVLLANRVLVGPEGIPGVIGAKPVHLTSPKEREAPLPVEQLYIDIGAKSKDEALGAAPLGTYVTFDTPFTRLGAGGAQGAAGSGRVAGKAFDDRAGCCVLAELLAESYYFDLLAVFTVQEEVGLRGAQVAAYALCPDLAFALEGTVCDDAPRPEGEDVSPTTRLGFGPAITITDASVVADRRLVELLMDTAEREGIPCQVKQPNVGGTDIGAIHLQRGGIPTAALSVPCRYIHSPESILDLGDLENCIRLMRASLMRLPSIPWKGR